MGASCLSDALVVVERQICELGVPQVLEEVVAGNQLELVRLDAESQARLNGAWTSWLQASSKIRICSM